MSSNCWNINEGPLHASLWTLRCDRKVECFSDMQRINLFRFNLNVDFGVNNVFIHQSVWDLRASRHLAELHLCVGLKLPPTFHQDETEIQFSGEPFLYVSSLKPSFSCVFFFFFFFFFCFFFSKKEK